MGSPQFFTFLLLISLLASNRHVIAQNESLSGFNGTERDALLALKHEFNNSILNDNWESIMCYLDKPPKWIGIQCVNGRVSGIVLENMGLSGNIKHDALFNLTQLSIISFKNNSISGNIMDFSHNEKLTQIDLSGNKFDGMIQDSLLPLKFLESLQLQDNMLIGSIPPFSQPSLRKFNVSNNRLSGPIPNTTVLQSFSFSSFSGNPDLCGSPSHTTCDEISKSHESIESRFGVLLVVIYVTGIVVLGVLFIIYYRKSKKLKMEMKKMNLVEEGADKGRKSIEMGKKSVDEEKRGKLIFMESEVRFELNDLLKASAKALGNGNFGNCYKTRLDDGRTVVVKRLRDLKPLSHDEFSKQVEAIADQKHPNLLPLMAYYYSIEEKLLIYTYVSNGNVYNRLHGGRRTKDRVPFRWSTRLSVARAVARALDHLHRNPTTHHPLPHGNLKSSNVLLHQNDAVLVSDHGLAALIAVPIATLRLVAYKSPEYQNHKKVSAKSDVWSYGCLLLELLTGRVSSHANPQGVDLGNWVHRAVREEWTAEIFDLEILGQGSANHAMLRLLEIAVQCCDRAPEKRPEMGEVVREVESITVAVDSEDDENVSLDRSLIDDSAPAT
ncbi:probable LRR receptor-like serine/threonine-protein kinase At4g31250 [Actinidia eriantha]|uniref:probable LRR receptor-like serine/threonine-protein kinase At4g31250 n=1 Tax=Actinidia eriantha TaxID=165200 RepID=UPI0025900D68|nr:probable LRR receptor-like serine/threonine-protein kinase At4g31250 [Actinidia eriantha]